MFFIIIHHILFDLHTAALSGFFKFVYTIFYAIFSYILSIFFITLPTDLMYIYFCIVIVLCYYYLAILFYKFYFLLFFILTDFYKMFTTCAVYNCVCANVHYKWIVLCQHNVVLSAQTLIVVFLAVWQDKHQVVPTDQECSKWCCSESQRGQCLHTEVYSNLLQSAKYQHTQAWWNHN